MSEESKIDPRHAKMRVVLRTLGPVVAGMGVLFIVIGFGSFITSFGNFEPPKYFWCAFVGIPLLFVGVVMCTFAFLGLLTRYIVAEAAPVQKDTFNYLADGTKGGVKTIASAIGEGLSAGRATNVCHRCKRTNDADAKFCKQCGAPLGA
jgi:hypothetical protein